MLEKNHNQSHLLLNFLTKLQIPNLDWIDLLSMADVGIAIVAEIVRKLVDAATDQARCSFCFHRHVKKLQKEKDNLQSKVES
ncbi:hypothetical protein K1719_011170 [Acacia pycnantha]|nr:hypothetical protein K1719_043156 [Acacia pycnantha]KAI9117755.1 hypothetical protein K1719_011170 [Acacia pycnantha]